MNPTTIDIVDPSRQFDLEGETFLITEAADFIVTEAGELMVSE